MRASIKKSGYRCLLAALLAVACVGGALAQNITYQYFYDASHQLTRVVDSTGLSVQYVYDAAGNITAINRSTLGSPGSLTIFSFSPSSGGPGSVVNVQGQGFSTTPASNTVTVNGVAAMVTSASATNLSIIVPAAATTGTIAVTVGASTATSSSPFTVVPTPLITGLSTKYVLTNSPPIALQVTGVNLGGSTFTFLPTLSPAALTVTAASVNVSGTQASLTVAINSTSGGTFVLQATNGSGSSSSIGTASNSLYLLAPGVDSDNDGLTNAQELQLGTDPLNPDTDGDGMPDGWEVANSLNPLDPSDANKLSKAADGLTNLQEFLGGTDPNNPDRTIPAVTSVSPANNAAAQPINSLIILVFNKPLLSAAQIATLAKLNPHVTGGLVTVTGGGGTIPGTAVLSGDGTQISFTPASNLPVTTTFTVSVSGFRTFAGVPMTAVFNSTFTTNNQADVTPPTVIRTSPFNNMTAVPTNAPYQVEFSKRIDTTTLNANSFYVYDDIAGKVAGLLTADGTGRIVTFKSTANLAVGRSFHVYLSQGPQGQTIRDLAGNALGGVTFGFTTGFGTDGTSPAITGNSPSPVSGYTVPQNGDIGISVNTQIMLDFSKTINEITAVRGVTVTYNGSPVPGSFTFLNADRRMLFVPAAPFLPGLTTVTTTQGLTDVAGNPISNTVAFQFTVDTPADTTGPNVTRANPPNAVGGVGRNVTLQARFSERMNQLTFNSSSFQVQDSNTGQQIAGTIAVTPDRKGASFTPTTPFGANTRYCWYLDYNTLLTDLSGNNLGGFSSCFTTGPTNDTTAPTVTGVNPPNLTTSVPLNAVIVAQISKPLSPVSFADNSTTAFALKANGANVAGTATLSADGMTMSFTSAAQLAPNTAFTITITGVKDYVGNTITTFSSTFTTGTSADTTQPFIISFAPANGAKNVATNSSVAITFSKLMNPLTANSGTIAIYQQSTGIYIAGTYAVDNSGNISPGGIVTFTPGGLMPSGSIIQVTVNGVQDFAGNNNQGSGETFTTAGTPDTTPPTVTSVTPTDGSTNLGLNTTVSLTFSKPLNPSTLNSNTFALYNGTTKLSTSIGHSQDNQTVNLTAGLPNNATITVIATSGVTDLSGNMLADFRSSFTTVQVSDGSRPSVNSQRPGIGVSGVPSNAPVVLFVNKVLNAGTVNGALHISQNGTLVTGAIAVTGNGQVVQFTPDAPFSPGAFVQVFFDSSATDTFGNALNNYQSSFTIAPDLTGVPPVVTSTSIPYGSTTASSNPAIEIQFSKPIDPATVNSTNLTLNFAQNQQVVPATVTLRTPQVIRITPNSGLFPTFNYYYQATTGVKDTTGLPLSSTATYYFTTGATKDTAQPHVSAVTPPDASTNIGTNAPVEVRFNKVLNPLTISTSTIQVTTGGNAIAPMSINFVNSSTQDILLTPINILPDGATINVSVSGVQDLSGNAVVPFTSSFTTRTGPDLKDPKVVITNPFSAATNVPINTNITLQFDKPIDPLTITGTSFAIYDNVTATFVPGTYSVTPNAMQASFAPSTNLAVGRQYTVYANYTSYIHDLAGNLLNGTNFSFTTAFTPSSTAPQVTLSSPEDTATGVPINALIRVQFNEPVESTSIQDVSLSANGAVVPGVVNSLSSGNTLLTLTPPTLLLGSTAYVVNITGVSDLAGNTLNPSVTKSFMTAPGADLTPGPVVTAENPPSGYRGVGTNVNPTAIFNKRLDPISINSSTVTMYDNTTNQYLPLTITPSLDRKSVSLKPNNGLKTNTSYCVYIQGVTDLVGNALYHNDCFFTGFGPDTTPPVITSMNPPNGSTTGVGTNVTLLFVASKPISPLSFNASTAVVLKAGAIPVTGTATLGSDLQTITFKPQNNLTANTSYNVTVSGFSDLQGNVVTPFTGTFTTSGGTDTVQPIVLSTVPTNNASSVATNTTITLNFSKPIDPITVNATNIQIYITPSGYYIAGSFLTSGSTVTFTPSTPIPGGSTIQVTINNVQDYAGNNNQGYGFRFTVASTSDMIAPTVTSVTPANNTANLGLNTIVSLTFSKSLNPQTVNNNTFALFNGVTRLSIGVAVSQDYRTVTLNANTLPENSTITVTATHDVQDLSGNHLADFQSQFSTVPHADATRPSVNGQRPGSGATGVPTNVPVSLFFNKQMDPPSTIAALNVSQNGVLVAGSAVLSGNGQVLTFTPSSPFAAGALIQIFEGTSALDTFGNALNGYTNSFTIAPDLTLAAPVVTGTIPGPIGNVVLNPVIEIQYSKPLDPTTVNGTNMGLFFQQNNQPVPATVSLRGDRTIRIVPSAALTPSFNYYYLVTTALKDTNGIAQASSYRQDFSTGTITDTAQPRVATITPPDQSVGVGVNAPIYLHFTKPLNKLTVSTGASNSIQITANGTPVAPASISFTSAQDVTVTPYGLFPDNTPITVTVTSGIEDPSGNQLVPFSASFTTRTGLYLQNGNVTRTSPVDGAQGIPLNTVIELETDDAIDPVSLSATLNSASLPLFDNDSATPNTPIAGTFSLSANARLITFVPSANLAASHHFRFYWNYNTTIRDISGNPLNGGSAAFVTASAASTTPPAVISTNPPDGYTNAPTNLVAQILFSEPIQGATIGGVTLAGGGSTLSVTKSLTGGNRIVTLVPPSLLQPNVTYTLTIAGVKDVAGNTMASTVTVTFTTGPGSDLITPVVSSTTPVNGATAVSTTTTGVAVFSEPMNPVTFAISDFQIYQESTGIKVAGTATLSADGLTATYTPSAPLLGNTVYRIYVTNMTDLAGNTVQGFNNARWTTGP